MHDSIIAVDRHGQVISWDEPDDTRTEVALDFDLTSRPGSAPAG